jgi:hypothetical protein
MKSVFLASCLIFLSSCGVKGNPQAPSNSPVLGRGEPNFSKATESVKVKKLKKVINNKTDPDWDEPSDFPEPKEEN